MRLTEHQVAAIREAAAVHFGPDAEVRVFGSRLDDERRGGDIDLYVETGLAEPREIARARNRFLAALYLAMGEQKIDVLVATRGRAPSGAVYTVAREQGVRL